jgi:hypothetical protein
MQGTLSVLTTSGGISRRGWWFQWVGRVGSVGTRRWVVGLWPEDRRTGNIEAPDQFQTDFEGDWRYRYNVATTAVALFFAIRVVALVHCRLI